MANEESSSSSSSRPSIGFPLAFALLLIVLFGISGFLIGCVNWHKIRALFHQSSDHDQNDDTRSDINRSTDVQPASLVKKSRPKFIKQSLPVLMPGDKVPRFLAMACSCEPPTIGKIQITVQKPLPVPMPFHYS